MTIFTRNNALFAALLGIILLVGAFLRFYALDAVPPGLSEDEGFNSTAAIMSYANREYQLFYMQGRWALTGPFIWLLALSIEIFGNNLWAVRFVPAFIGTLTLFAFFGLCAEYWREQKHKLELSLLATAFLAISFWHMHTTRLIFHGTLAPLCEVLALWSLLVAIRKESMKHYVLAGMLFISGIYSYWQYIPFMALPGLMILRSLWKKETSRKQFCAYMLAALVASIPFILAVLHQDLFHRVSQLTVTNQVRDEMGFFENAWYLLLEVKKNAAYTIGMLFLNGDSNWRHNYKSQASLGLFAQFGFVLAGVYYLRARYVAASPQSNMVWGWLLVAMLPAILTSQAVPHSWRANTMVVPLCMLAAYGIYSLLREVKGKWQPLAYGLLALGFIGSAYASYEAYFLKWGDDQQTRDAFDMRYVYDHYMSSDGPQYLDFTFVRQALEINERRRSEP